MTSPEKKPGLFQSLAGKIGLGGSAARRIYICEGPNCCRREDGAAAWKHLTEEISRRRIGSRVEAKKNKCFGVCGNGPVAFVCPERIWYDEMNPGRIDRVIEEHILKDKPVKGFIFEPPPDARPPE